MSFRLFIRILFLIIFIFLTVIFTIFLIPLELRSYQKIPKNAEEYLPVLVDVLVDCWNEIWHWDILAGQIEQETCISLTHSKCWNPKAELKTSREYGFGLAQITIAYDSEGRERFNNFKEATKLDKTMKDWRWEDRFNPYYQIRFLVLKDRQIFYLIKWTEDELNRFAFTLSAYNGGLNGMLRDRKMCETIPGCDPNIWFDNVEKESWRSKIKVSGYGKSFFEINREYVSKILKERRFKSVSYTHLTLPTIYSV